ncbi:MAG TPA: cyclic-phosphate processing receiver domain-containing protein [Nitrospirota bacterium]|nr:cyclic-phosphate processing receiver domain-containing protein [Nitrospirota bacterium]
MKLYLDDERMPPAGWKLVRWPEEAIAILKTGAVSALSLDHDLGDDRHGTGYDVILWIEQAVALEGFIPPKITVHSANASARQKMEAGMHSIQRLHERNEKRRGLS